MEKNALAVKDTVIRAAYRGRKICPENTFEKMPERVGKRLVK